MRGRTIAAAAIAVALTGTLSGCFSAFYLGEDAPILDRSDVVGTWVAEGPDGQRATIVLDDDGSATVTDLPSNLNWDASIHDDDVDWADTLDTAGTWELSIQRYDPITFVDIDTGNRQCCALYAMADDDGTHLLMTVSDPDNKIRAYFDKQD